MRYVESKYLVYQRDWAYRFYIADTLWASAENKKLSKRLSELIHPTPVDDRSGDEIAQDVIDRLELKVN